MTSTHMNNLNNITFKTLTLKNFLSVGDNPMVIDLSNSNNAVNIVTGSNGSGKSTILCDGISFALFGKSVRGLPKKRLVNNINQGGTECSIEFETGGHTYLIKRGIKPTVLELYKDGVMYNLTAHKVDTQTFINNKILRFNFITFTQTTVLTSMLYQSFMTQNSVNRRKFVESITGLNVIALALQANNENHKTVLNSINTLNNQLSNLQVKIEGLSSQIALLNQSQDDTVKQIVSNNSQLEQMTVTVEGIDAVLKEIDSIEIALSKLMIVIKENQVYKEQLNVSLNEKQGLLNHLNQTDWIDEMTNVVKQNKSVLDEQITLFKSTIEQYKYTIKTMKDVIRNINAIQQ